LVNTTGKARFGYFFRTDFVMYGFAISFMTPASSALSESFLAFFLGIHPFSGCVISVTESFEPMVERKEASPD
jgi:hypothetical protein